MDDLLNHPFFVNSSIFLQLRSFISLLTVSRILESNSLLSLSTLLFLSVQSGSVFADIIFLGTLWVSMDGITMFSIRNRPHPQIIFELIPSLTLTLAEMAQGHTDS